MVLLKQRYLSERNKESKNHRFTKQFTCLKHLLYSFQSICLIYLEQNSQVTPEKQASLLLHIIIDTSDYIKSVQNPVKFSFSDLYKYFLLKIQKYK